MPWRWAIEPGDRGAEDGGVGEVFAGDPQEQEVVGGEEPVDDGMAGQVVVESDPAQRQPGGGVGEEEVETESVDAAVKRLAAAFGADFEEFGEGNLAVDGAGRAEQLGEGVEAMLLVERGARGGLVSPLLPEQRTAAHGKQGRAQEKKSDLFHGSGYSPDVKDQDRHAIMRGGCDHFLLRF